MRCFYVSLTKGPRETCISTGKRGIAETLKHKDSSDTIPWCRQCRPLHAPRAALAHAQSSVERRVFFGCGHFACDKGPQYSGACARCTTHRARERTGRFEAQVNRKNFDRRARLLREEALHLLHKDLFPVVPEISAGPQLHAFLDGSLANQQAFRQFL